MSEKSETPTQPEASNTFQCLNCGTGFMPYVEIVEHILKKHGFDPMGMPCVARMVAHMDASEWSMTRTELKIEPKGQPPVVLMHENVQPRDPDDPMRFEG